MAHLEGLLTHSKKEELIEGPDQMKETTLTWRMACSSGSQWEWTARRSSFSTFSTQAPGKGVPASSSLAWNAPTFISSPDETGYTTTFYGNGVNLRVYEKDRGQDVHSLPHAVPCTVHASAHV